MTGGRRAVLVVDLAYGDCGKGSVVDFLARRYGAGTVVRFNGGPQAGHNVVTPDGRHHTFSQFGGGTFVPGVRTVLSRFMLVEPYALLNEAAHLESLGVGDATDRLVIDARCPVITPAHQAANRVRERARGAAAHGTCGMGVGETARDLLEHPELTLLARDLADRPAVARKLRAARGLKVDQLRDELKALRADPTAGPSVRALLDPSWVDVAVDNYAEVAARASVVEDPDVTGGGTVVFEGAQGVLLDEHFGFHPHTTWSTTTFANATALLDDAGFTGRRTRVGVLRAYATRHGPGPFVTEDEALRPLLAEPHNGDFGWQGRFRVGGFDAVAARYAVAAAGGVDLLAVTHLDRVAALPRRICHAYRCEVREEAFVRSGEWVTGILPSAVPDLARSERVGRALGKCQPVYREVRGDDPLAFAEEIGRELRASVGITSHGPTADDKRVTGTAIDPA